MSKDRALNIVRSQLVQIIININSMEEAQIKMCRQILKKNNLHPLKKLGRGGFSIVFLVEKIQLKQNENQLYSVKCISKKQFNKRPSLYKYIQQEINTWRTLSHPNIVRLVRTFEDEGWIFMLMDYCNKGNIHHVQVTRPKSIFSLDETVGIVGQILDGLEYMHDRNLIHRDIKADNVLIHCSSKTNKDEMTVKICDLGFVREEDDTVNTFCGTTSYMAPEIFQKKLYDCKVDIWALGVLIFNMLFDDFPFKGLNMENQIINKCSKGFNLLSAKIKSQHPHTKQEIQAVNDLLQQIFRLDPSQRPTIQAIKNHKIFRKQKLERLTSASSEGSEEQTQLQIQKCFFLREIQEQVRTAKFLNAYEELAFRFYLNKFILSSIQGKKQSKKLSKLIEQINIQNNQFSKFLQSNIKKVPIAKFQDHFKPSLKKFSEFKEAYRVVVGHAFSQAHKALSQDVNLRSRLKVKLFCCHVINRVFQKEHRRQIFIHYYSWQLRQGRSPKFDFGFFKKWLYVENSEVLVQTVQRMNNRFYKKQA